jgi:class 3 adenylate cyclase/tetratricopeptide (TPR) repeat protein
MNSERSPGRRAQRRHLTALFSDLSDSTALASSVDPEEFAELLEALNRTFEQIILRHGGTILQVRGDGVFAVFGMEAREDEGRRATEAALELHHAVKNISFSSPLPSFTGLTMHTGIHAGLVLAVEGDEVMGRFVLVGDAANLASRLSDVAGPDEILVSEASLGPERHFFETSEPRAINFDGVSDPLTVYAVRGRSEIDTRYQARALGTQIPMVGRERELNRLRCAFDASRRGEGQSVSIVAAPGVGKTRLVEEFFQELDGDQCLIFRCYCESYLNAEPLQPVLQMLRQLLDLPEPIPGSPEAVERQLETQLKALKPGLERHAGTAAALLSPNSRAPQPSEEEISLGISEIGEALAADRVLVAFIDDWQWADDATRVTLRNTPERAQLKLLLIRASREALPDGLATETIRLEPLDAAQSISMIEALIPNADRVEVDQVRRASGGNPLFIEELCHAVSRGAQTPILHERWQSAQIPNYVNMLVVSRVSQLSDAQLKLLQQIAVMGNVVPGWLLKSAVDLSRAAGAIEQLAELDLLFPLDEKGALRFKHGITREVVLDSLGRDLRQALHLEVAQIIEEQFEPTGRDSVIEALAYHYGETKEHQKAADYAEAAGDKAMAVSATDRARLQYHAALTALDKLDEDHVYERWMAVSRKLAEACLYDAERSQTRIYERAIELAGARNDPLNQAFAQYWLAYINYALGEAPAAKRHITAARAMADELGDESQKTQNLASWGQIYGNACEYDAALPALEEAMSRQAPFKRKPRVAFAYAYSLACKGMILSDQGNFREAFECFDEADELTRGVVHPTQGSIVCMRSGAYLWQGRWEEAKDSGRRNTELCDRMGSRYLAAMSSVQAAYARWQLDRSSSIDAMSRALSWVETNDQFIWTSMHFSWYCEVLVALGRYQEARRAAVWVLKRARKLERLGESVTYCALATIPSSPQAMASADRCFERARASAEHRQSRREHALIDLKEAAYLAERGLPLEARRVLDGCQERFSGMHMYWHAAEARRLEEALQSG